MSRYLLFGFLVLPMLSLGQERPAVPIAKLKPIAKSSLRKTLTITKPCAVLYGPDDAWIERHRKSGTAGFYTVADDMMYYVAQASEYLSERKIKTIDTQANTLRFILANGSAKVFDLRNSIYGWGLILFNGRDTPKEADLVEPEAAVRAVFGK